jgi:thioredoxin-like negative regulator of GroEL
MDKKIIYFSLKGCVQCAQYKPIFEKVANELKLPFELYVLPDAPFDVKKLVYKHSIETFPTILVINGETVSKQEGLKPETKLKEFLLA